MSDQAGTFDLEAMLAPGRAVEGYLQQVLAGRPLPENLREAALYSLLGPGKRLRPVLVIRACEAVGGRMEQAMAPAAAIEMIHCFSLIHDDLPAMDDDDLRRGRPTLHVHTNEAMAILAGDLLNTLAFELLCGEAVADAALRPRLTLELAKATNDMIAGQVYDTLPTFGPEVQPLERLRTIHRHKTGALIRASCRLGAIAAGLGEDDPHLAALTEYGEVIGLMFQVMDDLLDVTASAQQMGKATGKDQDQGKLTYPSVLGVDATRRFIEELHEQARASLAPLGPRGDLLRQLTQFMAVREK